MDVLHPRCAGLDVHKKTVVACALWSGPEALTEKVVRTFGTTTPELQDLATWLLDLDCTVVAMEATGVYWKPVFNILEEYPALSPVLLNAEHVKNVPGRKTDVNDAEWLATLLRYGLVHASFVPHRDQRDLRELTRLRVAFTHERTAAVNRLQKTLEAANLKLASVLSDIQGASGQRIINAIASGIDDPAELADLVDFRVKATREALHDALTGRLTQTLRFVVRQHLQHLADLDASIHHCDEEIDRLMRPFDDAVARLDDVPGINHTLACTILAETGVDLDRFPSPHHFAAWAGLAPGNRRSAGKHRRAPTRQGSPWLKAAAFAAATSAIKKKDSSFRPRYERIAARRGHKRAIVAVAHQIVVIIYCLLTRRTTYQDLGGAYFEQRNHDAIRKNSIRHLERLGYHVELTPSSS